MGDGPGMRFEYVPRLSDPTKLPQKLNEVNIGQN